jgi:hypothetical protein
MGLGEKNMLERYRTMKNSLFKRAVATAAAVPLALTQCLTTTFAVNVNTADLTKSGAVKAANDAQTVTLDNLLYIDPTVDNPTYSAPDLQAESAWNETLAAVIDMAETKGKASGTIDAAKFVDSIVSKAGSYKEIANQIAARLLDEDVTYEIVDGDVIIKGKVTQPNLNGNWEKSAGQALSQIAQAYNAPALNNVDFSAVKIGGSYTITVKTSALNEGTDVPVEFEYKNDNGTFGPGETFAYAIKCVEQIKQIGSDAIKKEVAADKADEAASKYEEKIDLILNKLNTAKKAYENAKTKSVSYDSVSAGAEAVNKYADKHNIKVTVPSTAVEIAAKKSVAKAFETAVGMVNNASPYTINIKADELGSFIDDLDAFEVALKNQKVTVYGEFEDAEAADVKAFYESKADDPDYGKYVKSYKIFDAAANFADIDSKGGDVDVKIKRVVITEPKATTTTTTSDTTSTTTSDTTSTTSSDTTSTTSSETTSTTTDTTPTTTTTSSDTTSTTSSDTTTTTSSDTTSTTSSETTTTTITNVKSVPVSKYATVKTSAGFYLDIDPEFHKEQIEEAMLYIKTQNIAVDEDGNEIEDADGNPVVLGEYTENAIDITDSVTFGDATPSNTYSADEKDFKYELPIYYRGEALNDVEGLPCEVEVYIGVKGDADLSNEVDGSDATLILQYFGNMQAGAGGVSVDANTVQMNKINPIVTGPESIYDEFSVFLADVDSKLTDNWKPGKKADRAIDGSDATLDLKYFGITTNTHNYGKATWDEILGALGQ